MTTGLFHFTVPAEAEGNRLDRFIADAAAAAGLALSRTRVQALIADGHVTGAAAAVRQPKFRVGAGETYAVLMPEPEPAAPMAQPMPLAVVFEDKHLLVLDKPAGLVVHPAAGHADGTLVNALIAHCGDSLSGIGGVKRPGIVHRLDKDTTGLMVVAKTDQAHAGLSETFADHGRTGSLIREYVAFVWGVPDPQSGTVSKPLGRDVHNRLKIAVTSSAKGRAAVTHWRRDAWFGDAAARLTCRLETGRTHQIRVHMAAIGHPVIGDPVYGTGFRTKAARLSPVAAARASALDRQALHAATLGFRHPVTGAELRFEAPLPADLIALSEALALS